MALAGGGRHEGKTPRSRHGFQKAAIRGLLFEN